MQERLAPSLDQEEQPVSKMRSGTSACSLRLFKGRLARGSVSAVQPEVLSFVCIAGYRQKRALEALGFGNDRPVQGSVLYAKSLGSV